MAHRPASASTAAATELGGGDPALLIRALIGGVSGETAWRQWRESVDVDRMSWESMQILPTLNGRLAEWVKDDPAAGIFLGIVRRAWTEAQVRLNEARTAAVELESAGCGPVLLVGAAGVAMRYRARGVVRAVPEVRLLIRREKLACAAEALERAGWRRQGELPTGDGLDWSREVYFSRRDTRLVLQWRLLPVTPDKAARHEAEFLEATGAEYTLLAALCGRSDSDPDVVPWQVDAALECTQAVDWGRFAALAALYAPQAFQRLAEMRELGLNVPVLSPGVKAGAGLKILARRIYRFVMRRLPSL